jgi:hypothetical protein
MTRDNGVMASTDRGPLSEPRSEAASELAQLFERRSELAQTAADYERAEQELREAERRRLGGLASTSEVGIAEKALTRARSAASQPWATKATAARQALRDLDRKISKHVAAHYGELQAELAEDAEASAAAIDGSLRDLQAAYAFRQEVEQRSTRLWNLVAHPQRNLTPESRVGSLITAAEALLSSGGEPPPLLPASHLPERAEVTIPEVESADAVSRPRRARPETNFA